MIQPKANDTLHYFILAIVYMIKDGGLTHDRNAKKLWDRLSKDLVKVIGLEAELIPYNQIMKAIGRYGYAQNFNWLNNPFTIKISKLKRMADRARGKNSSIELLRDWNKNND